MQYPIWHPGAYFYRRGRSEYIHTTGAAGDHQWWSNKQMQKENSTVTFKAIPDETIDKREQPKFIGWYNRRSEWWTRTGNTSVGVAYQALKLDIVSAEKYRPTVLKYKDQGQPTSTIFLKNWCKCLALQTKIHPRMFRQRYWKYLDQFIMSGRGIL